jgi:hypothetical protein
MKRNERCLQKTINYQMKKASDYTNKIFISFKKLYFDMKVNLKSNRNDLRNSEYNFNALTKKAQQRLMDVNLARFKALQFEGEGEDLHIPLKDDHPIEIDKEIKSFIKSCGNKLNTEEIEFMIHLIENYESFENGKITSTQLYDIWGALIHFSTLKAEDIIEYVFETYSEERKEIEPYAKGERNLNSAKIEEFLSYYEKYFNKEQRAFVINECHYSLTNHFSLDAFIHLLLSIRRYYPY